MLKEKYNNELKERARYLRKNSTLAEIILWKKLNKKQILGFDFDRQIPIDNFIVDFLCKELMLAIEVDGSSHDDKEEYDGFREEKLNKSGVFILRFTNDEVCDNLDFVVEKIISTVKQMIS